MNPLLVAVLGVCAVGITVALVAVLISLKRLIDRTESVMTLVEREVRPTASQLGALAEELRGVSHQVTLELQRIGMITRRLEDITETIAKVVGLVGGITRLGRLTGVAMGLQRGLGVFVSRLKQRQS
ncbi:MAG TPA: hypothetical protein VFG27_17375 [Pseudomonadales bacterium]|nr:hypothetical protein [Pseudomonadales bacterium]